MQRFFKLWLAATLSVAAFAAKADFTAADALISAPQAIRGSLSASTLADLVEYARAGMTSHTEKNALGEDARIWKLDSVHAELQTGVGRLVSINLLPLKTDTVVAVIETLHSQQPDSKLSIYSRNWSPISRLWVEPKPSEWTRVDPLPILLIEYVFSPENGILTLINHSEEKENMVSEMHFKWTDKGFTKIK